MPNVHPPGLGELGTPRIWISKPFAGFPITSTQQSGSYSRDGENRFFIRGRCRFNGIFPCRCNPLHSQRDSGPFRPGSNPGIHKGIERNPHREAIHYCPPAHRFFMMKDNIDDFASCPPWLRRPACPKSSLSTWSLSFGNIFARRFEHIWNGEEYADFRRRFARRRQAFREKWSPFSRAGQRCMPRPGTPGPEPPSPCMACHKMLEV